MTLINAWLSNNRAIVAVDTEAVDVDGTRVESSKLYCLPHSNLILASRGVQMFGRFVYNLMHQHNLNIDDAIERFDELQSIAIDHLRAMAAGNELFELALKSQLEVLLIGWSPKQGKFRASYQQQKLGIAFVDVFPGNWMATPYQTDWGKRPVDVPSSLASMERLARWQVSNGRRDFPAAALGGRLILVEMRPDGFKVTTTAEAY